MKISVALCTYNGEKFIQEQIDSILNQSQKVDEIVVCDDGSTDKTIEILNNYSENNPNLFKIYRNEINLRSVKNFEKAISICSGDIIFLSDKDDIWIENKVEDYIQYFNKNPTIAVLASNGYCIDEHGVLHDKYAIWDVPEFLRAEHIEVDYFALISKVENFTTGASIAIRTEIRSALLPFPIIKNFHHDEWIALIAANKTAFKLLPEKYFKYRIHGAQQVGGVFFDKTEKNKKMLTAVFNINRQPKNLYIYKKRLKKLCNCHSKNSRINEVCTSDIDFKLKIKEIEILFLSTKIAFKKSNPLSYIYISFFDKLFKKRILKKL